MENQYLDKEILNKAIEFNDITADSLISADNYNESKILNNFLKFNKDDQKLLLKCAIHTSVIGYGNRSYGAIRDDNNNVLNISDIYNRLSIQYNRNLNEKYEDDTLSLRRLIRLLRFQIQNFIITQNRPSFLWMKYSDKNLNKIAFCFPGAEHLIDNREDALYLMTAYGNVDKLLNTRFVPRLCRVFIAKGLLSPLEVKIPTI